MINRLRDALTGVFPALERAFDYSAHKGALVLLTGCQTPAANAVVARCGWVTWLANRGVRTADAVAATALEAARAQQTSLPGEEVAAQIIADLAVLQLLDLDDRLKRIDRQISQTFRARPQAEIIEFLPGVGPTLGAESVVAAGDLSAYAGAGDLACAAGLVPVPRDSGRRSGNLHRPKRYSRRLRTVFYLSARTSLIREGPNRDFYLKKRGEGLKHVQAVIALARRRRQRPVGTSARQSGIHLLPPGGAGSLTDRRSHGAVPFAGCGRAWPGFRRAGGWSARLCPRGRTGRPARRGAPTPGSLPAGR